MMSIPEYLYRVTSEEKLKIDESGYVFTHLKNSEFGGRSIPMAEFGDLEVVMRFFLFTGMLSVKQSFIVLKILSAEIEHLSSESVQLFEGKQFHGWVHKDAIKSVMVGNWIESWTDPKSINNKFGKHELGRDIIINTQYFKPVIEGELERSEVLK